MIKKCSDVNLYFMTLIFLGLTHSIFASGNDVKGDLKKIVVEMVVKELVHGVKAIPEHLQHHSTRKKQAVETIEMKKELGEDTSDYRSHSSSASWPLNIIENHFIHDKEDRRLAQQRDVYKQRLSEASARNTAYLTKTRDGRNQSGH